MASFEADSLSLHKLFDLCVLSMNCFMALTSFFKSDSSLILTINSDSSESRLCLLCAAKGCILLLIFYVFSNLVVLLRSLSLLTIFPALLVLLHLFSLPSVVDSFSVWT